MSSVWPLSSSLSTKLMEDASANMGACAEPLTAACNATHDMWVWPSFELVPLGRNFEGTPTVKLKPKSVLGIQRSTHHVQTNRSVSYDPLPQCFRIGASRGATGGASLSFLTGASGILFGPCFGCLNIAREPRKPGEPPWLLVGFAMLGHRLYFCTSRFGFEVRCEPVRNMFPVGGQKRRARPSSHALEGLWFLCWAVL